METMEEAADPLLLEEKDPSHAGNDKRRTHILCIPINWISQNSIKSRNSPLSTIILLLNSMIGSGILAQPYVFRSSGIFATLLAYIIVGYMMLSGMNLIIKSAELFEVYDYYELCCKSMGKFGGKALDISITINGLGALISYFIIIGSLGQEMIQNWFSTSEWYSKSYILIIFFAIFIITPLCLIRQYGHLVWISILSMIAIYGTVLLVIFGGPSSSSNFFSNAKTLKLFSLDGLLRTSGSIVFAFNFTAATFHAYSSLVPKSVIVYSRVVRTTIIIGACTCFLMGIIGYISFRNDTQADILDNFRHNWAGIFKMAIILHLLLYIPSDFVIMRHSLLNLFGRDSVAIENRFHIITTMLLITLCTVCSALIQRSSSTTVGFSGTVSMTGAIGGSLICFIIPGLIGMHSLQQHKIEWKRSVMVFLFGLVVMFGVPIGSYA